MALWNLCNKRVLFICLDLLNLTNSTPFQEIHTPLLREEVVNFLVEVGRTLYSFQDGSKKTFRGWSGTHT
jgi:hypothetical protein